MSEVTYESLVRDCVEHGDQWHVRWVTKVDSAGQTWLGFIYLDDDMELQTQWTRWPGLDGHVPQHEVAAMSRTYWFGVRYHGCDFMTLYRVRYGTSSVEIVSSDSPAYGEFEFMFQEEGGFNKTDKERFEEETESDEYREHVRQCAAYRGIR